MKKNWSFTLSDVTSNNLIQYSEDTGQKYSAAIEQILGYFFETEASEIEKDLTKLEREQEKLVLNLSMVEKNIASIKKKKLEQDTLEEKQKKDYLDSLDKWDRARIEAKKRRAKEKEAKIKEEAATKNA